MSNRTWLTGAQIVQQIGAVRTDGAKFYALVQQLAVESLHLISQTGDMAPAVELVNALPKASRREALALWFRDFSSKKLRLQVDKDTQLYRGRLDSDRAVSDFKVEDAELVHFGDYSQEPAAKKQMTVEQVLAWVRKVANDSKTIDGKPAVSDAAKVAASKMLAAVAA